MEDVKNITLNNGTTYTGSVEYYGLDAVPNGMGVCKFGDHNESGMFKNGQLDGIGYLNYHDWMMIGMCKDGEISGWGIRADLGKPLFGIFEDNVLKVDLTPLIRVFWHHINNIAAQLNRGLVQTLRTGSIFLGVSESYLGKRCGFYFTENGEVYLGACDYGHLDITGSFLHFDLDYNITKGRFDTGVLINEINDDEFIDECSVFVSHEYLDFDITMNYRPDSFLLDKTVLMHIFEVGKTNTNLVVKANICHVRGNQIQYKGGNCEDTTWFFFPLDEQIEDKINYILKNDDQPWAPDFSDYRVEFVNNLSNAGTDHLIVYKHISCWDNNATYNIDIYDYIDFDELDDENDIGFAFSSEHHSSLMEQLIPDYDIKSEQLSEQWRSKGWYYDYPSLRDYVSSLGEDDDVDNFFGWLFNNARFNGYRVWNLPPDFNQAFNQFLRLFPTIE